VIRNVRVDREIEEIEDAEVRRASQELTAEGREPGETAR
jgi:hypothetical protein